MATGVVRDLPLRRPRTVRRTLGPAMPRRIARRINGPKARKKARENAVRTRSRGPPFASGREAPPVLIATSSTNHKALSPACPCGRDTADSAVERWLERYVPGSVRDRHALNSDLAVELVGRGRSRLPTARGCPEAAGSPPHRS